MVDTPATEGRPVMRRDAGKLLNLAISLLRAAGCSEKDASIAAEVFIEADLRGIGLQGIDYLPLMIRALQSGRIRPGVAPVIKAEGDAYLLVDAGKGVGQSAAIFTCDLAIEKARTQGICVAGLLDASELYMLGYYTERIARAGQIGMAGTTWAPLVHPYGGMEAILSTNPISFSFPTAGKDPLVIDLATSALANGRIRHAAYHDENVPPGVGIGPDGRPATVAKEIQQGAISPLGGAKGYALSIAIALLCGPLIGADVGKALKGLKGGGPSEAKLGHFFLSIDPGKLLGDDSFPGRVSAFLDEIRSSKPAPGFERVRVPGDRTFDRRQESIETGLEILEATWKSIQEISSELKVNIGSD